MEQRSKVSKPEYEEIVKDSYVTDDEMFEIDTLLIQDCADIGSRVSPVQFGEGEIGIIYNIGWFWQVLQF